MATIGKIKITNENENITADDILLEADTINKEFQSIVMGKKAHPSGYKRKLLATDEKELDELFEHFRDLHKQFHQSYPMVLRHMIQDMIYSHTAFKEYLEKLSKKPWTNDDERFESYADYFSKLYVERNKSKHLSMTQINYIKNDYKTRLQKEHNEFKEMVEKSTNEFEARQKIAGEERRNEMIGAFLRIAREMNLDDSYVEEFNRLVSDPEIDTRMIEETVNKLRAIRAGINYESIENETSDLDNKLLTMETIHVDATEE